MSSERAGDPSGKTDQGLAPEIDSSRRKRDLGDEIYSQSESANQGYTEAEVKNRIDDLWDEEFRDRQQERTLKKTYADAFLEIARWQLVAVFFTTICSGLDLYHFHNNELGIIVAGTLAEVFGIVYVIARSLFDKNNKSPIPEYAKTAQKVKDIISAVESTRAGKDF